MPRRTRPVRPAVVLLLIAAASLACAGGKDEEDDDTGSIAQDPACAAYLECLTAVAPEAVGEALETYGEGGTCWTTTSTAEACAEACGSALDTVAEAYPDEPACGGASGADGLDGTHWIFTAEEVDNTCGYDWGVVEVEGDVEATGGDGFELVGTVIAHDLAESREAIFDTTLSCTLTDRSFTCDPVEIEAIGAYTSVVELSGTFGAGFTTAEATASNTSRSDGAVDCEATTVLSGTGG